VRALLALLPLLLAMGSMPKPRLVLIPVNSFCEVNAVGVPISPTPELVSYASASVRASYGPVTPGECVLVWDYDAPRLRIRCDYGNGVVTLSGPAVNNGGNGYSCFQTRDLTF
jgi:hypothetical protein